MTQEDLRPPRRGRLLCDACRS